MQKYQVLYTADLHGNEVQYWKLIDFAQKISADCVIIGGDIAPKNLPQNRFIESQRTFLKESLPQCLRPLKENLPSSRVFLMMGNDDCATNLDVLEDGEPTLYQVIHGQRIPLKDQFDIAGYSFVPITPFGIKDWEKFDLSQVPPELAAEYAQRKRKTYNLDGLKTSKREWKPFHFRPEMEQSDSIQRDFSQDLFQKDASQTVYVIHTPPNRTHLDQIASGVHVGSLAIRLFIEEFQPHLTLHGHIHETVDVSGRFKQNIGKTLCLSAGNHNVGESPAVLVFDLYNPQDAERIRL